MSFVVDWIFIDKISGSLKNIRHEKSVLLKAIKDLVNYFKTRSDNNKMPFFLSH